MPETLLMPGKELFTQTDIHHSEKSLKACSTLELLSGRQRRHRLILCSCQMVQIESFCPLELPLRCCRKTLSIFLNKVNPRTPARHVLSINIVYNCMLLYYYSVTSTIFKCDATICTNLMQCILYFQYLEASVIFLATLKSAGIFGAVV